MNESKAGQSVGRATVTAAILMIWCIVVAGVGTGIWIFLARGDLVVAAIFGSVSDIPLGFFPYSAGPFGLCLALTLATPTRRPYTWWIAPAVALLIGILSLTLELRIRGVDVVTLTDLSFLGNTLVTLGWATVFIGAQLALVNREWSVLAPLVMIASVYAIAITVVANGSLLELTLWFGLGFAGLTLSVLRSRRARQPSLSNPD